MGRVRRLGLHSEGVKPSVSRLLTKREVSAKVRLHISTINRWVASGKFPRPIARGYRYRRWYESVVQDWLDGRRRPPAKAS